MNNSFLPSELMHMATLSADCTKPPESRRGTFILDSRPHDLLPTRDGLGDKSALNSWQSHLQSLPPDETPELSHTPLSCSSSNSVVTAQPLHLLPELSFPSYVPNLDAFESHQAFHILQDCHNQLSLSDPTFQWVNSFDKNLLPIHSPKPIFAYKTLQFDLDRIQSPLLNANHTLEETMACGRKRCRDVDDEISQCGAGSKKRRTSLDQPEILPLYAEPSSPTAWRRSSFVDEACTTEDVSSMGMYFDNIYAWDDTPWSSLSWD